MKTQYRLGFPIWAAMMCAGWLLLSPQAAQAQTPACQAPNYVQWPASNPVWKLCWVAPAVSSGIDGSGVEIRQVYYQNKLIMDRAHIPVMNVKYDPGGCGDADLSYRDWMFEYQAFEATDVISSGYAEPTVPPKTVCDHPGQDAGTFSGVAVEKLADRLVLTSQLKAGWYRYTHKWTFYADGKIEPRLFFTAANNTCTPLPHYHNAYWRFDIDLAGPSNDMIQEQNAGTWSALAESSRVRDAAGRKWRVRDTVTNDTIELIPGIGDNAANSFAIADIWALAWRSGEIDDGGATAGANGNQAHISNYINGENIAAGTSDTVVWYRSGNYHNYAGVCEGTGPTLLVAAATSPPPPPPPPPSGLAAPSNLTAMATGPRQIKLTWQDNSTNEDRFKIERSTDGVGFVQIAAGPVTSYLDTGRQPNTTYYYRVRAANSTQISPYSNTASARTPAS